MQIFEGCTKSPRTPLLTKLTMQGYSCSATVPAEQFMGCKNHGIYFVP